MTYNTNVHNQTKENKSMKLHLFRIYMYYMKGHSILFVMNVINKRRNHILLCMYIILMCLKKRRTHNSDVHVYNRVALSNNLKMCNKTSNIVMLVLINVISLGQ